MIAVFKSDQMIINVFIFQTYFDHFENEYNIFITD